MLRNCLIFFLLLAGAALLSGWKLPRLQLGLRTKFRALSEQVEHLSDHRRIRAKRYVARINGHERESFATRSWKDAKTVYDTIGQPGRYGAVLQISLATALLGAGLGGVLLRSLPLAIVLAVGFYYLPLWLSQFRLYQYDNYVSEELEVALGLITTSYNRSSDILAAVEENLPHIKGPVRDVFAGFAQQVRYVDANAPVQIERMKAQIDNKLFCQWCDTLILCQENHTLQAALIPIVNKFADLKAQRQENATNMMLPLRRAVCMILLVLGVVPVIGVLNHEIYQNIVGTPLGQTAMVFTAIAVFVTINKAIALSKPITYDI